MSIELFSERAGETLELILKRQILRFDGNHRDWPTFIRFESSTRECQLTVDENFDRLQNDLSGEALNLVKHNLVHAEDIHWAIKTLKETYAHPGIVIDRAQQDAANNFDTHWNEIKEFAEKQHVCLEPTRVSKRKSNQFLEKMV